MSIDRATLGHALGLYLDELGVARYHPDAPYLEGDTVPAVFYRQRPDEPANAVTITVYDENHDRDDHNPDIYVQFHLRRAGCDPRVVDRYAAEVFDALHDKAHRLPGGIGVKLCRRKIAGMSDPDTAGRWSRPDSYIFTLDARATP